MLITFGFFTISHMYTLTFALCLHFHPPPKIIPYLPSISFHSMKIITQDDPFSLVLPHIHRQQSKCSSDLVNCSFTVSPLTNTALPHPLVVRRWGKPVPLWKSMQVNNHTCSYWKSNSKREMPTDNKPKHSRACAHALTRQTGFSSYVRFISSQESSFPYYICK